MATEADAPTWGAVKWMAPIVISLAGTVGGYKVLEYRVASLEANLAVVRSQRDADHEFLLKVAEDLRLFMCKQDATYCRR